MTDIEKALVWYDGNNDMPYCDLVWQALKEKGERGKGCNVCNREHFVMSYVQYSYMECMDEGTCICCPNCGRKL